MPIFLYVGTADDYATIEDSKWILQNVLAVKTLHKVQDFNHYDFQEKYDPKFVEA